MKTIAFLVATLSLVSAFAPQQVNSRFSTAIAAEQKSPLFNLITGMDRYNYGGDKFGARTQKNIKPGQITFKSYVPAGLSASEYDAIRKKEAAEKASKYQQKASKAFKFMPLDDFYKKRGTDLNFGWKSVTNGHSMAKTKYDWSGKKNEVKIPEAFKGSILGKK